MHEGCKYFVWPQNNAEFWRKKIQCNIERDKNNYDKLKQLGWNVVLVWECELKPKVVAQTLDELINKLKY